MVTLKNAHIEASFVSLGAELVALRDRAGRDFLWNGDPTWWKGRAPLLFPIVGRVPDDAIHVDGRSYPMRQHGLARISEFSLIEADATQCRFRLDSSAESRSHYPFDFRLDMIYALQDATLTLSVEVTNCGDRGMPVSFGFHPAFRWPMPGCTDKGEHRIIFEKPESEPIRRLVDGLLTDEKVTSPVSGDTLALRTELFAEDALIFDAIRSRSVTYRSPGSALRVDFPAMPFLGIWQKEGADFVCIEPWHGYAAPQNFEGDLAEKPGMQNLAPDATARFGMAITLDLPA